MVCFDTTLYDAIGSGGRDFTFSWSRVLTFTEKKLLLVIWRFQTKSVEPLFFCWLTCSPVVPPLWWCWAELRGGARCSQRARETEQKCCMCICRDAALHHFNLKQTTLVPAIWSGVIPHLEIYWFQFRYGDTTMPELLLLNKYHVFFSVQQGFFSILKLSEKMSSRFKQIFFSYVLTFPAL